MKIKKLKSSTLLPSRHPPTALVRPPLRPQRLFDGVPAHRQRDHHPEAVEAHEVEPKIKRLGARVDAALVEAGRKVERVPVELADGRDQRRKVPPGASDAVLVRGEGAQRAHEKGGDELHADGEGVARGVPRVGLGVLLPDLCQEVEPGARAEEGAVEDDVALDDEVDEGREAEPGDDGALTPGDGGEAGCGLVVVVVFLGF